MADGIVERFRRAFMPNSTLPFMRSMVSPEVNGLTVETQTVDEYVHTDLRYLKLLSRPQGKRTLVAFVGVQSHQFHSALDLAAYAHSNGCLAVIGGPHVMSCDTSIFHGRGVSFAQAEAELVWPETLHDAAEGEMQPVYGSERRWQQEIVAPVLVPPSRSELGRFRRWVSIRRAGVRSCATFVRSRKLPCGELAFVQASADIEDRRQSQDSDRRQN